MKKRGGSPREFYADMLAEIERLYAGYDHPDIEAELGKLRKKESQDSPAPSILHSFLIQFKFPTDGLAEKLKEVLEELDEIRQMIWDSVGAKPTGDRIEELEECLEKIRKQLLRRDKRKELQKKVKKKF